MGDAICFHTSSLLFLNLPFSFLAHKAKSAAPFAFIIPLVTFSLPFPSRFSCFLFLLLFPSFVSNPFGLRLTSLHPRSLSSSSLFFRHCSFCHCSRDRFKGE
ncbi:hypothetical protein QN277_004579 [Acacia crassicarpa]|uniref:Uncharacterized protein n=1 Tax=Acacia crassicarpa TaxID=499986 RepID=A0AAE1MDW9_9FABA|nr:hypothetical protein QN277_004579 [Acacia crassicarpa]